MGRTKGALNKKPKKEPVVKQPSEKKEKILKRQLPVKQEVPKKLVVEEKLQPVTLLKPNEIFGPRFITREYTCDEEKIQNMFSHLTVQEIIITQDVNDIIDFFQIDACRLTGVYPSYDNITDLITDDSMLYVIQKSVKINDEASKKTVNVLLEVIEKKRENHTRYNHCNLLILLISPRINAWLKEYWSIKNHNEDNLKTLRHVAEIQLIRSKERMATNRMFVLEHLTKFQRERKTWIAKMARIYVEDKRNFLAANPYINEMKEYNIELFDIQSYAMK